MYRPGAYNLRIIRRSTFRFVLRVFESLERGPLDLTQLTVLAQLWDRKREEKYLDLAIDDTYEKGGLLTFSITPDQTIPLPTLGVYDVKLIYPNRDEFFILAGTFLLTEGYTDD